MFPAFGLAISRLLGQGQYILDEEPSFLDPLNALPGVRAGWVGRIADVPVPLDKDRALCRLKAVHRERVQAQFGRELWWRAQQVHGNKVAVVPCEDVWMAGDGLPEVSGVDGLLTCVPGEVLGIYVADCGPIWLADKRSGAVGLLHSGRKGTEAGILGIAVELMAEQYGTRPADLVAVLGPCIRVPDYEVDFAGMIASQARELGLGAFHDCGINTAANLDAYYSYRVEKGRTGRMLALIARDAQA